MCHSLSFPWDKTVPELLNFLFYSHKIFEHANTTQICFKKTICLIPGGVTGIGLTAKAKAIRQSEEKEVFNVVYDQDVPLFSGSYQIWRPCFHSW